MMTRVLKMIYIKTKLKMLFLFSCLSIFITLYICHHNYALISIETVLTPIRVSRFQSKPTLTQIKCPIEVHDFIRSLQIPSISDKIVKSQITKDLIFIQVINNQVYQSAVHNEPLYERSRRESFLAFLNQHMAQSSKNFSLLLSVKDCCSHEGVVFSLTRCSGTLQMPIVQWNAIRDGSFVGWNRRMRVSRERVRKMSLWKDRAATAIFRGTVAGRWSFNEHGEPAVTRVGDHNYKDVGRTVLAIMANQTSSERLFNVLLRHAKTFVPSYPFAEAERELPMEEQAARYKYNMIVEGNCGWADRFKSFLAMGSLCFVQQTPCREYYGWLAKPWIHHVPIDGNLKNATTAIKWARHNDELAERIAVNGMLFADKFLTEQAMQCYMNSLFQAYEDRFEGSTVLNSGMSKVEFI